jgi:hypothetical protein
MRGSAGAGNELRDPQFCGYSIRYHQPIRERPKSASQTACSAATRLAVCRPDCGVGKPGTVGGYARPAALSLGTFRPTAEQLAMAFHERITLELGEGFTDLVGAAGPHANHFARASASKSVDR